MKIYKIAASINFANIDPHVVTLVDPADIRSILESFGSTMFTVGYVKKTDGMFSMMNARRNIDKHVLNQDEKIYNLISHLHRMQTTKMIDMWDNEYLIKLSREAKDELQARENAGEVISDIDKAKYIEKKTRKAYRTIYPESIEIILGGRQVFVNKNATYPAVRILLDKKNASENELPETNSPTNTIE